MSVEEEYLDVLQNIEATITQFYREHPELTDHQTEKALNGLLRVYQAETRGKNAPMIKLSDLEQPLSDNISAMCAWRLGREQSLVKQPLYQPDPISVDEMVLCLKRLQKSLRLWNKNNGIRGYLNYISNFN